ncbi:MAG: hypothetical protein DWH82_08080 [Planctomycetota bacterium]|nr:MAG: hypothetical protein DWH82_08080 [Planctomycetota bacterium]
MAGEYCNTVRLVPGGGGRVAGAVVNPAGGRKKSSSSGPLMTPLSVVRSIDGISAAPARRFSSSSNCLILAHVFCEVCR